MKEITRIHLAQTPYNIEVAAKKALEKYLAAVAAAFRTDEEALREIEARIVELLIERGVAGERVITAADVAAVEERLGKPGDFADEDAVAATGGKRLMRDTERGMIGGVLSGFAAYTGVDVVWWRIVAVILGLMSFGTVLLLYVVLWIVMPKATTAAERLHMRGVAPSLENLHEEAAREVPQVALQKKPLVVALRVMGVLTLLLSMLAPVAIVGFGLFGVTMAWQAYEWLVNGWLVVAAGLGAASGLLLVVLFAIGVYGLTAWRATRAMAITTIVVIMTGLLMFTGALGAAFAGSTQVQRDIEAHTESYRQPLTSLTGVEKVTFATMPEGVPIEYRVTDGAPYAAIETLNKSNERARLVVEVGADKTATVRLAGLPQEQCERHLFAACSLEFTKITLYGPAVQAVTTGDVALQYYATSQESLRLDVGKSAVVSLYGAVGSLEATLADNAELGADGATVTHVKAAVAPSSRTTIGVAESLEVIAPASCPADSDASIVIQKVATLKTALGDAQQHEMRQNCATIEVDEPSSAAVK